MISIDPTDECTFWPIHEYFTTTNPPGCSATACWHTRFGFLPEVVAVVAAVAVVEVVVAVEVEVAVVDVL
jgi:hypothetical protein